VAVRGSIPRAGSQMAAADQQTTTVAQLAERVDRLESELESKDERIDDLENQVDELSTQNQILQARVDAMDRATDDHDDALAEIQSRELEKGAHLKYDNVERRAADLDVEGDRLEKFAGDDDVQYCRLPGECDPLERSGSSSLAQGDLLPIQQLARLDDDMLRSTTDSTPSRLAAKLWSEREQDDLDPWSKGSSGVRHYLDSSDLRHWIRRVEDGVSETYAKKLAQRTLDAVENLAKGRVYSQRKSRRKDGLRYKERRLILPSDSDIPGEQEG